MQLIMSRFRLNQSLFCTKFVSSVIDCVFFMCYHVSGDSAQKMIRTEKINLFMHIKHQSCTISEGKNQRSSIVAYKNGASAKRPNLYALSQQSNNQIM
jgi:hypothetical protein